MKRTADKSFIPADVKLILSCIFALPLYWFSFLVPRSRNIWVFGAWFGLRYGDNPRYFFEYVQKQKNIKAIWIAGDRKVVSQVRALGFPAFLRYSLWGIYYMLRASVAVIGSGLGDFNRALIYRAFKINLWHGAPMKRLNYDNNGVKPEKSVKFCWRKVIQAITPYAAEMKTYQLILATSEYFKPIMANAFDVSLANIQVLGYPRNDILFDKNHRPPYIESLKRYDFAKMIAYLPTYRDSFGPQNLFTDYGYDRQAMEDFLEETNSILLLKLHYADQVKKENKLFDFGKRVICVDEKEISDINDILGAIDVLITDYSGVYFDYLLLNRPVVFAAFDLEEYIKERGLDDDYEFYLSGPVAKNWSQVIDCTRRALQNPKEHEKLRAQKSIIFNKYQDEKSCERVFKAIIDKY